MPRDRDGSGPGKCPVRSLDLRGGMVIFLGNLESKPLNPIGYTGISDPGTLRYLSPGHPNPITQEE